MSKTLGISQLDKQTIPLDRLDREVTESCAAGDYVLAERLLNNAIRQAEDYGKLDPRLPFAIHSLAALYCTQRRYQDAERLYWQGLVTREKILGPDHPDVADSLERLAVILRETKGKNEAMYVAFRAQTLASHRKAKV